MESKKVEKNNNSKGEKVEKVCDVKKELQQKNNDQKEENLTLPKV